RPISKPLQQRRNRSGNVDVDAFINGAAEEIENLLDEFPVRSRHQPAPDAMEARLTEGLSHQFIERCFHRTLRQPADKSSRPPKRAESLQAIANEQSGAKGRPGIVANIVFKRGGQRFAVNVWLAPDELPRVSGRSLVSYAVSL